MAGPEDVLARARPRCGSMSARGARFRRAHVTLGIIYALEQFLRVKRARTLTNSFLSLLFSLSLPLSPSFLALSLSLLPLF